MLFPSIRNVQPPIRLSFSTRVISLCLSLSRLLFRVPSSVSFLDRGRFEAETRVLSVQMSGNHRSQTRLICLRIGDRRREEDLKEEQREVVKRRTTSLPLPTSLSTSYRFYEELRVIHCYSLYIISSKPRQFCPSSLSIR